MNKLLSFNLLLGMTLSMSPLAHAQKANDKLPSFRFESAAQSVEKSTSFANSILTEGTAYFSTNSSVAPKNFSELYCDIIEALRADPNKKIILEGHTDMRASARYNLHLSFRRSLSIARALTKAGVEPRQIEIKSLGEYAPIENSSAPSALQKNRRVTLSVVKTIPKPSPEPQPTPEPTPIPLPPPIEISEADPVVASIQWPFKTPDQKLNTILFPRGDRWSYGGTFEGGYRYSNLYYTPNPQGPGNRSVDRQSIELSSSAWVARNDVKLAEIDGTIGVTQGRTSGGGGLTLNVLDTSTHSNLFARTEYAASVGFSHVNPIEVGIQTRASVSSPMDVRAGVIPISYFYQNRGFHDGELGTGMQLWGSGLHVKTSYQPIDVPGLTLTADAQALLGFIGVNRWSMFGEQSQQFGEVVSDTISPHTLLDLKAEYAFSGQMAVSSSLQYNWMKYRSTKGVDARLSETSVKLNFIYTP